MADTNRSDHDLLIILNNKVDHILRVLDEIPTHANRLNALEKADAVKAEQIETIDCEVGKLRSNSTVWSVVNSIAAGVAGLVGFIK